MSFFIQFLRHPILTGSVVPSSKELAKLMKVKAATDFKLAGVPKTEKVAQTVKRAILAK